MRKLILFIFAAGTMAALAQKKSQPGPHPGGEAFRAARDACATEQGLKKPAPGQRPSEEDRKKMETCLEGKGFPKPPPGQRPPPPPDQDSRSGEGDEQIKETGH